jgi:hypothetical protein
VELNGHAVAHFLPGSRVLDRLSVFQPPTRVGFPTPDTGQKKF